MTFCSCCMTKLGVHATSHLYRVNDTPLGRAFPSLRADPSGCVHNRKEGAPVKFLHSMIRVRDLDESLRFFVDLLGLKEVRRRDVPAGRFTLIFLSTGSEGDSAEIELTHNWDQEEPYTGGRNFGHLAFSVEDIYETCERLQAGGVTILRPPRDGRMAFVRSPDQISVELLQKGEALPLKEPWASMPSTGSW